MAVNADKRGRSFLLVDGKCPELERLVPDGWLQNLTECDDVNKPICTRILGQIFYPIGIGHIANHVFVPIFRTGKLIQIGHSDFVIGHFFCPSVCVTLAGIFLPFRSRSCVNRKIGGELQGEPIFRLIQ